MRLNKKANDVLKSGIIDKLIRDKKITNVMASSLINDSAYAYNISKNLIQMASSIYLNRQNELKEFDVTLDDKEISSLIK